MQETVTPRTALFQYHPHTFFVTGGGEAMLENTYRQLLAKGWDAFKYDPWSRNDEGIGLFHLFGSHNGVCELYGALQGRNIPLVVSAIDYMPMPRWKLKALGLFQKGCPLTLPYDHRQRLFDYASAIIANSRAEKAYLLDYFRLPPEKITVIPVGVSSGFYGVTSESFPQTYGLEEYVLCVGRINPRKGQIRTIQALEGLGRPLVFIGREDPSDMDYFHRFKKMADATENVHWIGQLDNDSDLLASAFARAAVHVLPSDPPEFPGIASLEAGMAGTRVVTTKAPTVTETLGDHGFYCTPEPGSIRETVERALAVPKNRALADHLRTHYAWETVTDRIIDLYRTAGGVS